MSEMKRTAMVTGATSGLGFEAAVQLAENGHLPVVITGRTSERIEAARRRLAERTGLDVFSPLVVDLNDKASVDQAVATVAARQMTIGLLLLNAGMVGGNTLIKTDEGVEIAMASSLIGHHRLTMGLLGADTLAPSARIIIAGSEAARGDVPTFKPTDLVDHAVANYGGDLAAAATGIMRADGRLKYKASTAYADAKLFVAHWAAQLAERLPDGMAVNAVSPGSAPDTDAGRNANFFMRNVMMPMFKLIPGMSADVAVAASRYLEAAEYPVETTGRFFASAPKKMTGPLHQVMLPHVEDRVAAAAVWEATVAVSGGIDYPIAA